MKNENVYQSNLKKRIEKEIPGCIILKNDPTDILGIPDLTVLSPNGKYVVLECKREKNASKRALQEYYVNMFDGYSYSSFVDPSNEDEVIDKMKAVLL